MSRYANDQLREKCQREIDAISDKRELSTTDLDRACKLTDIIKNTYKIDMYEDGGYSGNGEWTAHGNYDRGSSYRRDSMGRYARDGYMRNGYSGGTMEEHLDAMLRDARTEEERRMIEDMKRKMMM